MQSVQLPLTDMLLISRLPPAHRSAYAEHLMALDAGDRALRFGCAMADDAIERHTAGLNLCRDLVLVARDRTAIVGAAHVSYYSDADSLPIASIAVSVAASCRQAGVGKQLVQEGIRVARLDGATRAVCFVAPDNTSMLATVKSCGLQELVAGEFGCSTCSEPEPHRAILSVELGIEVYRAGEVGQGVWLIHGAGGDAWQWRSSVMPALVKRGYSVEALSFRSTTATGTNERQSVATHIRDCLQVFKHQQPFMVIGHCIGAIVATRLATIVEPERVVLANPMPADGMSELDRAQSVGALDCRQAQLTLSQLSDYLPQPRLRGTQLTVVAGHHDRVSPPDYCSRTVAHHRSPANRYDIEGGHQAIRTQRFANLVLEAALGGNVRRERARITG